MQKQLLGRKIMARIRYRLEYIPRKTTFRFVFFTTQYQRQRKCFFFRARAEKGIAWHIDASNVVWTLIYHGKFILANQIARLAAIVVKLYMPAVEKLWFPCMQIRISPMWTYFSCLTRRISNSQLFPFISKDTLIVKNLPKNPWSYESLNHLYGQRY